MSSDQISYEAPSITSAPGFNSIATGTPERIYILGSNFGDGQSAVSVRYTNSNGDVFATGCIPVTTIGLPVTRLLVLAQACNGL